MNLNPSNSYNVDYYVDADIGGRWGVEDDQGPICDKSRTGFLFIFMRCPLIWCSKL